MKKTMTSLVLLALLGCEAIGIEKKDDNACYRCSINTTASGGGYTQSTNTTTEVCNASDRKQIEKGTTSTSTTQGITVTVRSKGTCRKI